MEINTESRWWRSSFCADSACVEVSMEQGLVRVRDSKHVDSPVLEFNAAEWAAFVKGVQAGELSPCHQVD